MSVLIELSVVVATRDRPVLLREAVASIAAQEGIGPLEIIVVHDQSEVDESIAEAAPGVLVRVVSNMHETGLAGARNSGIELAEGEFVAFCDDDDLWLPEKAATQIAELRRRPDAALVTCGIIVDYDGVQHPRYLPTDTVTLDELIRDRHTEFHSSAFLFRTQALKAMGIVSVAVPGGFGEDYELLLRTARRGEIANIPRPMTVVRWHQASYFFERWKTMADGLSFLVAMYPEFRRDRRGFARIQGQVAFARVSEGKRRAGLAAAGQAWRAYPLEPRVPLTVLVASGLIKPERIMAQLHRFGRGL